MVVLPSRPVLIVMAGVEIARRHVVDIQHGGVFLGIRRVEIGIRHGRVGSSSRHRDAQNFPNYALLVPAELKVDKKN